MNSIFRKTLLTTIVLLTLLTFAGVAQADTRTGKELFAANCQACHGPLGKGDGPASQVLNPKPRDLTQRPYKQGCGPGAIVRTLKIGVAGSAMPSFKDTLSEEEMWKLGHYVRSLQSSCCQDKQP